jgi:hypothetical protein
MALIRFYEELNDYLPEGKRKQDIYIPIHEDCTLRSILTSLNVPIEAVDLILVNSQPVDADCIMDPDDRVSVYPVFERFNIKSVTRVRSRTLRRPKFITDSELKALADQMSALGFDVVCHDSAVLNEMIKRAEKEKRTILTLDRELVRQRTVIRAIVLKAQPTKAQIQEIRQYLDL